MNRDLVSAAHRHNLAMAGANTLSHQLKGEAALDPESPLPDTAGAR